MKKIALLFTILCAGHLYSMEAERIVDLPKELQDIIAQTAIESSDNLDETILMIKKLSLSYKVPHSTLFNNIKDFTKLVHLLAKKFNMATLDVAYLFAYNLKIPAAQQYKSLYFKAIDGKPYAYYNSDILNQLIADGLDINLTYTPQNHTSLLINATHHATPKIVALLLTAGANPYYKDKNGLTALDYAKQVSIFNKQQPMDRAAIVKLLEEAMQKKLQEQQ